MILTDATVENIFHCFSHMHTTVRITFVKIYSALLPLNYVKRWIQAFQKRPKKRNTPVNFVSTIFLVSIFSLALLSSLVFNIFLSFFINLRHSFSVFPESTPHFGLKNGRETLPCLVEFLQGKKILKFYENFYAFFKALVVQSYTKVPLFLIMCNRQEGEKENHNYQKVIEKDKKLFEYFSVNEIL